MANNKRTNNKEGHTMVTYATRCWFLIQLAGLFIIILSELLSKDSFMFLDEAGVIWVILWPIISWFWIFGIVCVQHFLIGWKQWWKLLILPVITLLLGLIELFNIYGFMTGAFTSNLGLIFFIPLVLDSSPIMFLMSFGVNLKLDNFILDLLIFFSRSLYFFGVLWLLRRLGSKKFEFKK